MKQSLNRSSSDKFIAGVCGGIARSFGIDAAIVRIAFVVLAILGFSIGIWVYLIAWLLLPIDGGTSGFEDLRRMFTSNPNNNTDLR